MDKNSKQDYATFSKSKKLIPSLKAGMPSTESESDSDSDFKKEIETIQKYISKKSKASDELSKDYYEQKLKSCAEVQMKKKTRW